MMYWLPGTVAVTLAVLRLVAQRTLWLVAAARQTLWLTAAAQQTPWLVAMA